MPASPDAAWTVASSGLWKTKARDRLCGLPDISRSMAPDDANCLAMGKVEAGASRTHMQVLMA